MPDTIHPKSNMSSNINMIIDKALSLSGSNGNEEKVASIILISQMLNHDCFSVRLKKNRREEIILKIIENISPRFILQLFVKGTVEIAVITSAVRDVIRQIMLEYPKVLRMFESQIHEIVELWLVHKQEMKRSSRDEPYPSASVPAEIDTERVLETLLLALSQHATHINTPILIIESVTDQAVRKKCMAVSDVLCLVKGVVEGRGALTPLSLSLSVSGSLRSLVLQTLHTGQQERERDVCLTCLLSLLLHLSPQWIGTREETEKEGERERVGYPSVANFAQVLCTSLHAETHLLLAEGLHYTLEQQEKDERREERAVRMLEVCVRLLDRCLDLLLGDETERERETEGEREGERETEAHKDEDRVQISCNGSWTSLPGDVLLNIRQSLYGMLHELIDFTRRLHDTHTAGPRQHAVAAREMDDRKRNMMRIIAGCVGRWSVEDSSLASPVCGCASYLLLYSDVPTALPTIKSERDSIWRHISNPFSSCAPEDPVTVSRSYPASDTHGSTIIETVADPVCVLLPCLLSALNEEEREEEDTREESRGVVLGGSEVKGLLSRLLVLVCISLEHLQDLLSHESVLLHQSYSVCYGAAEMLVQCGALASYSLWTDVDERQSVQRALLQCARLVKEKSVELTERVSAASRMDETIAISHIAFLDNLFIIAEYNAC